MNNDSQKSTYIIAGSVVGAGALIALSIVFTSGGMTFSLPGTDGQLAKVGARADSGGAAVELTADDVVMGDLDAPVAFVDYGDYQCPFCGRFFTLVEPQLRENYVKTGVVQRVFRNFAFLGPESFAAAEAAECAKDQKQFWGYHDLLFEEEIKDGAEHNGNLNRELFMKIAGELNLNTEIFAECIDSKKYAAKIEEDSAAAHDVGVNSTPTVFVNGGLISGACPFEVFQKAVQAAERGDEWAVFQCQFSS